MNSLELHIVAACAVLLALEPAGKLWRRAANWLERQANHRRHLRQLEKENG